MNFESIPSSNIGYKLLLRMGWKENANIGKNQITFGNQTFNSAANNPIEMILKFSKAGLGAPKYVRPSIDDE